MAHAAVTDITKENRRAEGLTGLLVTVGGGVGLAGLVASVLITLATNDWAAGFKAYLINFAYFLSLSLGALFFVLKQHLTRAGWSVLVRRIAEVVANTLPLMGLLAIPLLFGLKTLYPWADPDPKGHDYELILHKTSYLNTTFFIIRLAIYFIAWSLMARYFYRTSVAQDGTGDVNLTRQMQRLSAPLTLVYAVTLTLASFDLLMSLKTTWYSTIYGVYYFSGAFLGFMALLILICLWLQANGRLSKAITGEHYHDMGKWMFAFVVFWAYIAFSQYMLIWYANMPEATAWYTDRQIDGWYRIGLVLLFGHFFLPFVALLSRVPKRIPNLLAIAAVWMLLMHWIDIFYLGAPSGSGGVQLLAVHITTFAGIGGLFVAAVARGLAKHSLIPERDPRLPESIAFENF
jgi:hypothetical protein